MSDHSEKRKSQFKRRLLAISKMINDELEKNPNAEALGLVLKRDTWVMIRLALAFSRKTNTKKLPSV